MLKAGSLLYAIFISFLITSMVSIFVLAFYFNQLQLLNYEGKVKAIHHLNSGLNLLLANSDLKHTINNQQLFPNDLSSDIKLSSTPWGLYHLLKVSTSFKNDTFFKAAIAGYCNKNLQTALYLVDRNQPISLAGEARIKGNAYLSERGLKRAFIEGRNYSGTQLIEGRVFKSNKILPAINYEVKNNLEMHLRGGISSLADTVFIYDQDQNMGSLSIIRSTKKSILEIYSNRRIHLISGSIKGSILIHSDKEIIIGQNFNMENTIVSAPYIVFKNGFNGTLQAIASDSILIEKNCKLNYPSSISVISDNNDAYIEFGNNSSITGDVLLFSNNFQSKNSMISIKESATVVGNVYSTNMIELKGNIYGMLTSEKLFLKTRSSVYENHILDGAIDINKLPEAYVGSGIIPEWSKKTKNIISWLN